MKSSATAEFWKRFAALPHDVQRAARAAYRLWESDPRHNSLRLKKIGSIWVVRVARGYRALGVLKGDTVHWFWIGRHDEYERVLRL